MLLLAKTGDSFKLKLTHQPYSSLLLYPASEARTQDSRREHNTQYFKGYKERMTVS